MSSRQKIFGRTSLNSMLKGILKNNPLFFACRYNSGSKGTNGNIKRDVFSSCLRYLGYNATGNVERAALHLGCDDEQTSDLRTAKRHHEMAGAPAAHW